MYVSREIVRECGFLDGGIEVDGLWSTGVDVGRQEGNTGMQFLLLYEGIVFYGSTYGDGWSVVSRVRMQDMNYRYGGGELQKKIVCLESVLESFLEIFQYKYRYCTGIVVS